MALCTWSTTGSMHQSKRELQYRESVGKTSLLDSYKRAQSAEENPIIPSSGIFSFDASPEVSTSRATSLPTVAECAAHLELLEAFKHLRFRIISSGSLDSVLGIEPKLRTAFRTMYGSRTGWYRKEVKLRDETFNQRRKDKWPFFLRLATARFFTWLEMVDLDSQEPLLLPPLDILIVWHSLLLNPKMFLSLGLDRLSRLRFPWEEIHKAIDSRRADWPFTSPMSCEFLKRTGLYPDMLEALTTGIQSQEIKELLRKYDNGGILWTDINKILETGTDFHPGEQLLLRGLRFTICEKNIITPCINAIQRQLSFVDKMDQQLWIRSPALEGTLLRATQRYLNFLSLFKMYPNALLVPTIDIDLVWHTHLCSPEEYLSATKSLAARSINHDDTIGEYELGRGFKKTNDLYRMRFAEDYVYCTCWDCEAVRSAAEEQGLAGTGVPEDVADQIARDVAYYRAVELARRAGDERLPIRS